MLKIGDKVFHVTEGTGTVRHIRRSEKIVWVQWDSGSCTEHYLPYVHKVEN